MTIDNQKEHLQNEVVLANLGNIVLKNKAYQDALAIRKAQIFDVFCNSSYAQSDIRDEAWRTMKNMNALEMYFNQLLSTGKMAEQSLDQLNRED